MARELVLPDAWVDQEVNIIYIGAGKTNDFNCTLRDVNERGVGVERGDTTSFFPWTSSQESTEARESPESSGPTGELGELREQLDTEQARRDMAESTLREGMAEEQRRREEVERERDELRQELHALREPRESPEPDGEQQGRGEPHSATGGAQESARRSWWRRVFGR